MNFRNKITILIGIQFFLCLFSFGLVMADYGTKIHVQLIKEDLTIPDGTAYYPAEVISDTISKKIEGIDHKLKYGAMGFVCLSFVASTVNLSYLAWRVYAELYFEGEEGRGSEEEEAHEAQKEHMKKVPSKRIFNPALLVYKKNTSTVAAAADAPVTPPV